MGITLCPLPADAGDMKGFFGTRPDHGTLVLLATATAFLVVSFLMPTDPVASSRSHDQVIAEFAFGWKTILVAALRIACLLCLVFAALRQRDTVESAALTDRP
jgi:hypothetical protein